MLRGEAGHQTLVLLDAGIVTELQPRVGGRAALLILLMLLSLPLLLCHGWHIATPLSLAVSLIVAVGPND